MKCFGCGSLEDKVIDTRILNDGACIRRRRECLSCGKRYTTYENIETTPILVIKNNQTRETFNKEKIKSGIIKACEKRPVSISQINEVVDSIEKEIQNLQKSEIETKLIGELVMDKLKKLDDIAYVRFASVYRQFTDVTNFINFLKGLN